MRKTARDEDGDTMLAKVRAAETAWLLGAYATSSPNEWWAALKDVAAGIDDSFDNIDKQRKDLYGEMSAAGQMRAAVDAGNALGKKLVSAKWMQATGWSLEWV